MLSYASSMSTMVGKPESTKQKWLKVGKPRVNFTSTGGKTCINGILSRSLVCCVLASSKDNGKPGQEGRGRIDVRDDCLQTELVVLAPRAKDESGASLTAQTRQGR